jgi:hypothetical protein
MLIITDIALNKKLLLVLFQTLSIQARSECCIPW